MKKGTAAHWYNSQRTTVQEIACSIQVTGLA